MYSQFIISADTAMECIDKGKLGGIMRDGRLSGGGKNKIKTERSVRNQ